MSTVSDIENAVQKHSRQDLTAFRDWFLGFDAAAWLLCSSVCFAGLGVIIRCNRKINVETQA